MHLWLRISPLKTVCKGNNNYGIIQHISKENISEVHYYLDFGIEYIAKVD